MGNKQAQEKEKFSEPVRSLPPMFKSEKDKEIIKILKFKNIEDRRNGCEKLSEKQKIRCNKLLDQERAQSSHKIINQKSDSVVKDLLEVNKKLERYSSELARLITGLPLQNKKEILKRIENKQLIDKKQKKLVIGSEEEVISQFIETFTKKKEKNQTDIQTLDAYFAHYNFKKKVKTKYHRKSKRKVRKSKRKVRKSKRKVRKSKRKVRKSR